jgi:hypothetical protein
MKEKKYCVTIFRLPWGKTIDWERREEWYLFREEGMSFKTHLAGEEAAEEAFHLTNAPEDCLEESQKEFLRFLNFKGPSLSVGDIVRVAPVLRDTFSDYYICKSFGWEKYEGDYFKLLKHLY